MKIKKYPKHRNLSIVKEELQELRNNNRGKVITLEEALEEND